MVDFIVKNYLIIVIAGAFLIFALIGFAVDTAKNKSKKEAEILNQPNESDEEIATAEAIAEEQIKEEKKE